MRAEGGGGDCKKWPHCCSLDGDLDNDLYMYVDAWVSSLLLCEMQKDFKGKSACATMVLLQIYYCTFTHKK